MTATIDKSTKVRLGLLLPVLVFLGGVMWQVDSISDGLSKQTMSVQAVNGSLKGVKQSIDRIMNELVRNGKALVRTETRLDSIERRMQELEKRK